MSRYQKLELTWIGKDEELNLEPRILIEDKSKAYGERDTENMLIKGDNLLALKALEADFTGKVKCIYIDPPYNTGNAFEHYDDGLEHSLWLNLMRHRLVILRNLLREDGSIWISIDDDECHYLKVLCDEIFGRINFIASLPTIMNLKGNQDQFGFAGTHEYTLVYAKDKKNVQLNKFPINDEEVLEQWSEDDVSYYKKGATLKSTGEESSREDRPNMFYPILYKDKEIHSITDEEYENLYNKKTKNFNDVSLKKICQKYEELGYTVILPYKSQDILGRWRWGFFDSFYSQHKTEIIANENKDGVSLYKKQRPTIGELPSSKPKSLFYKPEYSSGNGTGQIKALFGYNAFPYPKPEDLIKDFIHLASNPGDLILDSFLGSGTTAAVAHKMGRRWIGIELGEHCDTHCVPRLQKVIDGTDQGGISKAMNWTGGGGFKYYNLPPSLLQQDEKENWLINPDYDENMLAEAMAKHQGFTYKPNLESFWKQGFSTENDYIYTTDKLISLKLLEEIHSSMRAGETLLICCKAFEAKCKNAFDNITIKKIPASILKKCEFGKEDYSLKITETNSEEEPSLA